MQAFSDWKVYYKSKILRHTTNSHLSSAVAAEFQLEAVQKAVMVTVIAPKRTL
jgi:hypothetical protein